MVSPLRCDDCFIHGCLYISEVREIQERQKKILPRTNPEQEFKTKFLVIGKIVLTLCDMPSR
jgi:hypothetical protein